MSLRCVRAGLGGTSIPKSTNIGAVEQASPFPALKLLRILKHAQNGGDTLGRGNVGMRRG